MKFSCLKKSICAAALLFTGVLLFAADIKPRFALVIGNQNYEEGKLKNPIADAKLIKESLEECAFTVKYYEDLSLNNLKQAVLEYSDMVNEAGSDVISLIYYSGHGVQIDGQNYIVPVDNGTIKTENEAKMNCFMVGDIFTYVKAKSQVFILDACRDNPFKSDKKIFSKGLSTIQAPKNIGFIYLFSTQAGATAADGDGKNSLFTQVLANELKEYNESINTVFANVALNVTEKSGGRQTPLYTGTSIDFVFLDEAVADMKIAKLNSKMNELKAMEKKEGDVAKAAEYKTEQSLLDAEIKHAKDIKAKAKADADEKEKKAKEQAERDKKLKQETEKLRKQTEELLKQQRLLKAKQQSSKDFIDLIEADKMRLKEIRSMAFNKILSADLDTTARTEKRIEEINNQEYKMSDKTSTGELTAAAKKRTNNQIDQVLKEDEAEKINNEKEFHDMIRDEEKHLLAEIEKNNKALAKTVYVASSVLDEARFDVIDNYDGNKFLWYVRAYSNIYGDQSLVNTKMEIPYMKLANVKKVNIDDDNYSDSVENYDFYLRDSELKTLFDVQIVYTITAVDGVNSYYNFKASEVNIYFNEDAGDATKARLVSSKKVNFARTIRWTDVDEDKVKTIAELYADYNKEQAELKKQEDAKKKQEEKEALAMQKMREREEKRQAKALEPTLAEKIENWGGSQEKLDGLQFDINLGAQPGISAGWNFGINNYLSAEAFLCAREIGYVDLYYSEGITKFFTVGVGAHIKAHVNYELPNSAILIPVVYTGIQANSNVGLCFELGAGVEYLFEIIDFQLSVGLAGTLNASGTAGPNGIVDIYARIPLDSIMDLF